MSNKFFEFFATGLLTPVIYLVYSLFAILGTFVLGLPIAFGIYFIQLAMNLLLSNGG
jgi:hypothetical protein